jgi:molybdate transport system substrate-binding protein
MRNKSCIALIGCVLFAAAPLASAAEIRVLCSNGVRAVMEDLKPRFERASGHKLAMQFSSTANLKQRIEAGEAFDVAFLTSEAVDDLIQQAKLAAPTRADLARSGVGIGIRKGAAKLDVSSGDAVKRAMLRAKSIAYTGNGASRPAIDRMFERLGIAAEVRPKVLLKGAGEAPETVARGDAEVVITLISEILPVPGVELAGPLPAEFQNYVSFATAAAPKAANPDAVQALIQFAHAPDAASTYKARGMEPR